MKKSPATQTEASVSKNIERVMAVVIAVSLAILAYVAEPGGGSNLRWYSVIPPLVAVTLALLTHRVIPSIVVAVLTGGFLAQLGKGNVILGGVKDSTQYVWGSASDTANFQILIFVVLVMAMISVMIKSGGMQGIVRWLSQYATSVRSTKFVTALMGLALFIDDYANTMIIGSALRPMTDKMKISREKLAFLVDATAAPVAGLAIISTWIGYEVGLFEKTAESLGINLDGYTLFFDALGFRFYCILMIVFVLINSLSGRDFGPMAKAEKRAAEKGKLVADDAKPTTSNTFAAAQAHPQVKESAWSAIVPILSLFVVLIGGLWLDGGGGKLFSASPLNVLSFSAWRQVFATSENSILLLAIAAGVGLSLSILLSFAVSELPINVMMKSVVSGLRASVLPVTILILAWSLKAACDGLHTGDFLTTVLSGKLSPNIFPLLLFIVAGMTAFATGTSWGTMAILIPTAIPVAYGLDGGSYGLITMISLGAVLDGAIFGDHCSPISDTTIMSSIASSCDHIHHVQTQMPYALTVGAIALICGYLPAAAGVPSWAGILLGTGVIGLVFFVLGKPLQLKTPLRKISRAAAH